jgi:bacillithiol biosynthesis cysteine-adding enzyme BshC
MVIPTKQLPNLPLLVDHYFYDYGRVQEFYNGDFRDRAAFERQTERVQSRPIPRDALAEVLYEQNERYGCGPQTLGHIEKIVREKAGAVVTGQQVGLFSGPLYTIYKALTAVKLAERLHQRSLGCFVPVFWLASDDHDSAEIDHIALLDKDNRLEEVRCRMPSPELKIPVSNLLLPPEISDCLQRLKDLTLDSEFKAEMIDHLSEAYQPGRSYVEAFARWMTRLFKPQGLIFIDPSHVRLRELGSEVFYHEIAEESPSTRQAIAASRALRQAGYGEQVHLHEGLLNIFYTERERRTIQWKGGAFGIKEAPSSSKKEELLTLAKEKPYLFSPNVLLRPIYQDAILPTVAYVGGPGEIAYFAQMKGVYEEFRLPMPVIYPRKTVTIVERKIGHVLEKYNLQLPDFWRDASRIIGEISQTQVPESIQKASSLIFGHLEQDFESLKREMMAFEPGLKDSADLAQRKMHQQLNFLGKKILQSAKTQNEIAVRQIRKAIDNLYPNQHLQERVFNIVPYLIKYGAALMDKLDQAVDIDEHDHQIIPM